MTKRKLKKQMVTSSALVLACVSTLFSVDVQAAETVKLAKSSATLTITKESEKTTYGKTTIKIKSGKGIKVKKVTYKAKNNKIVSVTKKGVVKAKKKGSTKITATVKYKKGKKTRTKKLVFKVKVQEKEKNVSKQETTDFNTNSTPENTVKPTATPAMTANSTPENTVKPTETPVPTVTPTQSGADDTASVSSPSEKKDTEDENATIVTYDCVYLGSYWQSDNNGDGTADKQDTKEPIKWRVLSVDGNDAFLISDKTLECLPYNEATDESSHFYRQSVTWEDSTLRKWLNEDFYNTSFTDEEKKAIKTTVVTNADNPDYGTEGGNDTNDKIYLLSLDEVKDSKLGFSPYCFEAENREINSSEYAEQLAGYKYGAWYLRSSGYAPYVAAFVAYDGHVYSSGDIDGAGVDVTRQRGIRPVLHLDLSQIKLNKAEPKSFANYELDTKEVAALQEIIKEQKSKGATMSEDITDYTWTKGKLTEIDWYNTNIQGDLELSAFTSLETLGCSSNKITKLDVSKCTNLSTLYCNDNQISELDVSKCTNLYRLECNNNQISKLDVSGCVEMGDMNCSSNPIRNLDVSKCTELWNLDCGDTQITELNVKPCTKLETLYCGTNPIAELDLSACTELMALQCADSVNVIGYDGKRSENKDDLSE